MDKNIKIFAVYMSEDKEVLLNLSSRLDVLDKTNSISFWNDDPVHPKQKWIPQDESRLKSADVFLFLLSNAFMHSEFIKQIEFKNIIDRYKEGDAKVIPVLINDCPWDIDFRADDYNFNFNELQVLPEGRKPMEGWGSLEEAYENCSASLKNIIAPNLDATEEEVSVLEEAEEKDKGIASNSEEQIAINFSEETEAKKIAEEEQRITAKAEEERIAKEELRRKQEAEATKRVQQELKIKEAEAKRIADEKRVSEEIEAKRIAAEEQRRLEKEEALRVAEERQNEEERSPIKNNGKKKALIGALIAVLLLAGIFLFSGGDNENLEQDVPILPETEAIVQEDSTPAQMTITEANSEPKTLGAGATMEKLGVGERYDGGIVFEIDQNRNSGKIVHYDDAGPMTWNEAMKIHEQFGEGWRVPTFEELKLMYKTVGQGANNEGEFADELYWSATPYDENQAKMVRFRDGNTSYHYNRRGTHRKYLVRAIKDFSR